MIVCGKEINIRGSLIRIAYPELDKYELLTDPQELLAGLRKSGTRIDLFTFMQIMPETSPKFAYPMEWDNLAVLRVSTFDQWWNHQIRSDARNRARQAEKKGVMIREVPFDEALVQGMWEVYNESSIRQGKPNVHYGKDIQTVRAAEATFLDRSLFVGAFLGEKLIGFVKLVTDENRTQANLMNIVSVRSCAERNIGYLVYQNFTYSNKKPDSLTKFKEVNGFQRVDLPRYYVPLTRTGRVGFQLGLHRRFTDHIPEPLLYRLRKLRASWYNLVFQSATKAP